MNIILYVLAVIIGVIVLLSLIGLIMPKNRTSKKVVTFSSDLKTVWDVVINNEDYEWRSDISKIEILDGGESWIEYSHKNDSTTFKTIAKNKNKEYSFSMYNAIFTGQFISKFQNSPCEGGKVEFIETISIKSPILKPLSYLFFDLQGFQNKYIYDLKKKLNEVV